MDGETDMITSFVKEEISTDNILLIKWFFFSKRVWLKKTKHFNLFAAFQNVVCLMVQASSDGDLIFGPLSDSLNVLTPAG